MTNPFGGGPKTAAPSAAKAPAKKAAAKAPAAKAADEAPAADPTDDQEPQALTKASGGDPFAQPAGPGEYRIQDMLDEVLLVKPYEEDVIKTKISDNSEVIRCDIIRIDNENERCDDVLIFQTALLRTFRKVLNGPNNWTIGKLEMGEEKNGRNAPYIFTRVDEADIARGVAVAKELGLDL